MLFVYLKRRCYPLFSRKFLIGQLYSNWPGSSSRTVTGALSSISKVPICMGFDLYNYIIGHFRVMFCLYFKMSPYAKLLSSNAFS